MSDYKYMMGTTAIHQLGDISREEEDLCLVRFEHGDNYVGSWVTGMGFMEVKFPKATTRELNEVEIEFFNKQFVQLASNPPMKLKVD